MSTWRQAVHLFMKDLRRFWPAVVGLGVLLVAQALTASPDTVLSTGWLRRAVGMVSSISVSISMLAGLLGAIVVHEDRPAGGQPFWATRPFERRALLWAKLGFVGIFLMAVPLVLQAWAIRSHGTGDPLRPLLVESAVAHGATVAVVVALASVTRNLKSLVLTGLGLMIVFSAVGSFAAQPSFIASPGVALTRDFLAQAWWLVAGTLLVAHQFLTHRTRRTFVLGAIVMLMGTSLSHFAQVDLSRGGMKPFERFEAPDMGNLALKLQDVQHLPRSATMMGAGDEGLNAQLEVLDVPDHRILGVGPVSVRITGDDLDVRHRPPYFSELSAYRRVALELPGYRVVRPDRYTGGRPSRYFGARLFVGPKEEVDRIRQRADRLEIRAVLDAWELDEIGRLPLRVDAQVKTGSGTVRLRGVSWFGEALELSLETTWIAAALDRTRSMPNRVEFALVNEERREYIRIDGNGSNSGRIGFVLPGPKLAYQWTQAAVQLAEWSLEGEPPVPLPEDWIRGAELVVLGPRYVGSVRGVLRTADVAWPRNFEELDPSARKDALRRETLLVGREAELIASLPEEERKRALEALRENR